MKILPSILDANLANLQLEIDSIATSDRVHLDVMDGQFVPNFSFGPSIMRDIETDLDIEAHLMVENPGNFFDMFSGLSNLSGITFHIENTGIAHAIELLQNLKNRNLLAGISIDGYTDPAFLTDEILALSDQVLVMSIKSGFGGQKFRPDCLEKIKTLRSRGFVGEIVVDGGINFDTGAQVAEAGADSVVVGSFLMKSPAETRAGIIEKFHQI